MNTAPSRILLLGTENADGTIAGVTTGASQAINAPDLSLRTVYLTSIGTTSGGTILIEEADWADKSAPFSGTWSQVQSIAASSFTGGAQVAVHITPCAYGFLRVRISSPITGGGSILASLRSLGQS